MSSRLNVKILNISSQIAQRPDCNRKDFENYLSFNFFPLWEKCKIKGYPEKYNPK